MEQDPLSLPNEINTAYLLSYGSTNVLVFRACSYVSDRNSPTRVPVLDKQRRLLADLRHVKHYMCRYVDVIDANDAHGTRETVPIARMISRVAARVRRLEKKRRGL